MENSTAPAPTPKGPRLICTFLCMFASLPAFAQTPIETPACGRALGGDYDVQPPQEKQARRVNYASCWRGWGDTIVRRAYGMILREVSGYEGSLREVTYGIIRAEADTAVKLQASEQQSERAEFERRYAEEGRAIQQQATPQNRAATNQRRREALERARAEGLALQQRQTAERAELQASIRSVYLRADAEIAGRVADDRENLAEQQRTKLRDLERVFAGLANVAPGQSIAEYESAQDTGSEDEWSFFGVLRSLHIFTSRLVGRQGPDDDPAPQPVDDLGIRG